MRWNGFMAKIMHRSKMWPLGERGYLTVADSTIPGDKLSLQRSLLLQTNVLVPPKPANRVFRMKHLGHESVRMTSIWCGLYSERYILQRKSLQKIRDMEIVVFKSSLLLLRSFIFLTLSMALLSLVIVIQDWCIAFSWPILVVNII